ncbi:NAD(P)-binding protein [Aspergillus steynii IBT 23096]|uniref:NAD(P)-binding protein n=1 Tax=Aspergillus steynii IBT 23096 TaxID=1392250 RepID=A0A2I2FSU4_9EURO|nr:NAD(P)-binding protein [Aspergillus steynii IBT 23096]PLB43692.1 NAD(P)-binding protein [Aspergillus steynii IBT 23096]
MARTILIAGATGNTGRSVVETLPSLLASSNTLSDHRVIALTRSLDGPVAQAFAKLPDVEVIEQSWVEITADWLRKHEVVRAFIASHNDPNQFAEESTFHQAALKAGVEYVVRISTTAPNVRPDSNAYYPRSHWAIEALLGSEEYSTLKWTSLQPNAFSQFYFSSALEFIKKFRETGKQDTLGLMAAKDAPVGIIDPADVGVFAAHLLAQDDVSVHNKAKYVMNGPEDITGEQLVGMVEQQIGTRVENVSYKDMSFLDSYLEFRFAGTQDSKNVVSSIKHALEVVWEGKCSASTTSKEVLELAAPKRTPADVWKDMLEG